MRKPSVLLSFLFLLAIAIVHWGRMPVFCAARPAASGNAAAATAKQEQSPGQQNFIGYPGDVVTYHYNVYRQGQNTGDHADPLQREFQRVSEDRLHAAVDGKVDAQPLYVYKLPAHSICKTPCLS